DVSRSEEEQRRVQLAKHGAGPMLQRDYVVVLEGAACSPEDAMLKLRSDFPRYSPRRLCKFDRPEDGEGPLRSGATMQVHLRGAGPAAVLVTHVDPRRLTLRTQEGHQEAGRISFGASYDPGGRLVIRIRSRARQRNFPRFIAYALVGMRVQSRIWAEFLTRLAAECGGRGPGGGGTCTPPRLA